MSQTRRLLSHTLIYAIGLGASRGIGVFLVPLYTRKLSTTDFALWDLCTTTVLFTVAIIEIGMSSAMARYFIQADSDDERRHIAQTGSAITLVAALLGIAAAWPIDDWLARVCLGDPATSDLINLVVFIAAATILANQPLALLRARERSVQFSVLCLFRTAVSVSCILGLLYFVEASPRSILLGDLAGLLAAAIAGFFLGGRYHLPRINIEAGRKLLNFGIPLIPISIATIITLTSDRYFLRAAVGMEALAVYSLGFKVAMVLSLASQALQTAYAPSAFHVARTEGALQTLATSFRHLLTGLAGMALTLTALAPELVRVFGPQETYVGADAIVPWIAFSYVLQSAAVIVTTNLVIVNRTMLAMYGYLAGAGTKLALNVVMIPAFGIEGAAAATLIAYSVQLAVALLMTRSVYPVPYETARLLMLAALALTATTAAAAATALPLLAGLACRATVLAAFLAALPLLGVIPRSELDRLRAWVRPHR